MLRKCNLIEINLISSYIMTKKRNFLPCLHSSGVERLPCKQKVGGSNPPGGSNFLKGTSQWPAGAVLCTPRKRREFDSIRKTDAVSGSFLIYVGDWCRTFRCRFNLNNKQTQIF